MYKRVVMYSRHEKGCVVRVGTLVFFMLFYVGWCFLICRVCFFFFNDTATTEIYTLSLHDALPIYTDEKVRKAVNDALRKIKK